ncbi:MAG: HlyC/CorC family transporter [Clostridia bacterium]|nr:HlyC/CorC family transporter [Clostridia bacterium]
MTDIVKHLLLQLILILLNAFFAATEIAVISLNEKKLKARAEDGDKKAVKMLKMTEDPTQFLSTIQIGITLAGFLGSAFAADNFAEKLSGYFVKTFSISANQAGMINNLSVVCITIILSFFTLVLGELAPKRIAMKHKEKLAEGVCGFISGLAILLKPIIWLLSVSTNAVIRLFGIDPNEKEEPVSEEDIVMLLDAGAGEGSLDENDIEYIKNVFKLDGMTAESVMTPRRSLVNISQDATIEEILEIIETEGYSRIPVYGENSDNIIGILHSRDFLLKHNRPDFKLEDVMFQPTFVPETAHLDALFKDMQKEHNHIVVVVTEYGETAGIVTMEDILEEIVGEIWDERDEAIEEFVKLSDDTYKVLCSASIENFFEYFDMEYDEEIEATTVNGWLAELIGSIPEQEYSLDYENLSITVTKANDLMAEEITVKVNEISEEPDIEED